MQTRDALTAERWHGKAVTKSWQRGLKARANTPTYLPSQSRTRRASSPMGGSLRVVNAKKIPRRGDS